MAVQLAAARGATLVATASPAQHGFFRKLGAVLVASGDGLAERVRTAAPGGIDAALDLVGTDEAIDVSLALVADQARIATIVAVRRSWRPGSRFSVARRARSQAPRSATMLAWNLRGSPRRGHCTSS